MLKKIIRLQNVGLFQNGVPKPLEADRATLIYADNGRGKSTLASMLRACWRGDSAKVQARKTIDATGDTEIEMLFAKNGKIMPVSFSKGAWITTFPDLYIFDSEFVEQNVYSGFEVRSDQRQSLLDFVLGDQAVLAKQRISQITKDIDVATKRRTEAEKNINRHTFGIPLSRFIELPNVPDAQQKVDAIRQRIEAAQKAQKLVERQNPVALSKIGFDVQRFFEILAKRIDDIEKAAEDIVREHFEKHQAAGIEDWISRGQVFLQGSDCPFCGQSTGGIELVRAYQTYFNQAYSRLKQEVAVLERGVNLRLSESKMDGIKSAIETNDARIEAWKDQLEIAKPALDMQLLLGALQTAHGVALDLAVRKQNQPLESVGSHTEQVAITSALAHIDAAIDAYNLEIDRITERISALKQQMAGDDVKALESQMQSLQGSMRRHQSEVEALVREYRAAEADKKKLDQDKTLARESLDELMKVTLQQYQSRINTLLGRLGASFSIEQMKPNYQGTGDPRTEYVLVLRKKPVKLGNRSDSGLNFGTALSEADKRTLAFAFFIAKLEADHGLADRVVVFDDPVSSLDRNRRFQTINMIARLTKLCAQSIVLSHDPYFVRDVRDKLQALKPDGITPKVFEITRAIGDYSEFAICDIDSVCASPYYRNHALVKAYVDGESTTDMRDVARAIRPLLEGFYHRRFPGVISRRMMFGNIISNIVEAEDQNPLSHLRTVVRDLSEINDYTAKFHHGTGDEAEESVMVVDAELLGYAKKALDLIYKGVA